MTDKIHKKKRSRSGLISYINKLMIKGDIFQNTFKAKRIKNTSKNTTVKEGQNASPFSDVINEQSLENILHLPSLY